MENKLLSICVPTYNRRVHIKRMIDYFEEERNSIDFSQIQIIISNNASNDGTSDLLKCYVNKYEWLEINNNTENIGAYSNFQLLFNLAKGEYFWMPGDDDYLKKGLVAKVINCIKTNRPNYIYMSRRVINETSKNIIREGKKHAVDYDVLTDINHKQLVNLVCENFGDLKFQTSSIFKKEILNVIDLDFGIYDSQVRANCHSIYRSIRLIQEGKSFFFSEVCILNGNETTWSDRMIDYQIGDIRFIEGLTSFGFSKNECNYIRKRQLASLLPYYMVHHDKKKEWIKKGGPSWIIDLIPIAAFLIIRKLFRKVGLSNSHITATVDINDFVEIEK